MTMDDDRKPPFALQPGVRAALVGAPMPSTPDPDTLQRQRKGSAFQLESARKEISLVKRWLDAVQESSHWPQWTDPQRGSLIRLQRDLTELQLRLRSLTLQFVDSKKEIIDVENDPE